MHAIDSNDAESPEDSYPPGASDETIPFDAAFGQAVQAYLRRDYADALARFERALTLQPKEPRCLKNIALIKDRLGKESR